MRPYNPRAEVAAYLAKALEFVKGVPYKTTTRWAFYQLVQFAGLTKEDYARFKKWTAKARKSGHGGWRPDTLVDDTRALITRAIGPDTSQEWIEQKKKEKPYFDKNNEREVIVQVWFEARAMIDQFRHYCAPYHVSMAPFGGDASIHYKWVMAKRLDKLAEWYPGKPIIVKYFGDLDPKGLLIPESALKDIRAWCKTPFEFERVGLDKEHAIRWNLPDNPEKPGQYQWEALPDEGAKELIVGALAPLIDLDKIAKVEKHENRVHKRWREALDGIELEEEG